MLLISRETGRVRFMPAIFLRTHAPSAPINTHRSKSSPPRRGGAFLRDFAGTPRRAASIELRFAAICHSHHRPRAKGADACKKSTLVWRRLAPNAGVRRRQASVSPANNTPSIREISKIVRARAHFHAFPLQETRFFLGHVDIPTASKNFEK